MERLIMNIKNTVKLSKIVTLTLSTVLSFTACTKKRAAELPESQKESIFAISEFGQLDDGGSQFNLKTSEELSKLGLTEKNIAINENGRVGIAEVNVPKRIKYMFLGLEISGSTNKSYPVTFSVDRQYVTAYKIVKDVSELTVIEKQLAKTKEILDLKRQLQLSNDVKNNKILLSKIVNSEKMKDGLILNNNSGVSFLVPIFKYKIESYGKLQKVKNELKEDTSTLELKSSEWAQATHVQLNTHSTGRLDVGLSTENKEQLERIFVSEKIDNQIMTAKQFSEQFSVPLEIEPNSLVYTEVSEKGLFLYLLTNSKDKKISTDLMNKIRSGNDSNNKICSDKVKQLVKNQLADDCLMILTSTVPISFVKVLLPKVDTDGNESNDLKIESVSYNDDRSMIRIEKNAIADYKLDNISQLQGDSLLKISDLIGKEFFYRRTIEDAPYALGLITPGDTTNIFLVHFELKENRLVVINNTEYLQYKVEKNDINSEELMSFPAKFFKTKSRTVSNKYQKGLDLVETSANDAEYIQIAWNNNTLPMAQSPLSFMGLGQCLAAVGDKSITDLDNRVSKGILNFSYQYSATSLNECLNSYEEDYYWYGRFSETRQYNVRVKERISFMLNDGSTDKSYLPEVSFKVKHGIGVGNWTTLKVNPDKFGRISGRAQKSYQANAPDFSNGKVLKYTLMGLPNEDQERRKQLLEVMQKVIGDWNSAYQIALKNTKLERTGKYIDFEIDGENGVKAHLGDLDKHIIYFENKFSSGNGGISLTGVNPRSGLTVSDLVIIHQSNIASWVNGDIISAKRLDDYYSKANKYGDQFTFNLTAQTQLMAKKQSSSNIVELSPEEKRALEEKSKSLQLKKLNKNQLKNLFEQISKNKQLMNFKYADMLGKTESNYAWVMKINQEFLKNPRMSKNEFRALFYKELLNSNAKMDDQTRTTISKLLNTINKRIEISKYRSSISSCKDGYNFQESNSVYAKMDFPTAFKSFLTYIIAHELGHSQGLVHNFMGSFDKANMVEEKGNERNYSSVMDYINSPEIKYNGIGNYDIHTIKAIQTGLVELNDQVVKFIKDKNLTKFLVNEKFIQIENLRDIYSAANSMKSKPDWEDVDLASLKTYVKEYKLCTDIDLGAIPNCRVWDSGVSFQEMLKQDIQEYENSYALGYYHWDRSSYGYLQVYNAMFYTIAKLAEIRSYLDGFIMNTRANPFINDEEAQDHITAVGNSMRFLMSQVAAPSTQLARESDVPFDVLQDRFIKYQDAFTESPLLIQFKSDFPVTKFADRTDGNDQFDSAGNLANRITALQFLIGSSRTDQESTRLGFNISYLDYELSALKVTAKDSSIINLIYSIIIDSSRPIAYNNNTGDIAVLFGMRQSTPYILRLISGMNALYGLENSILKPGYNFANLFKIRRGTYNIPTDKRTIITNEIDESKVKVDTTRYWTIDDSFVTDNLLQKTSILKSYVKNLDKINEIIKPIINSLIFEGQVRNKLRPQQVEGDVSVITQQKNEAKAKLIAFLKDDNNGILKALQSLQDSENKRNNQNNSVSIEASVDFAIDYVAKSYDMSVMTAKDPKNIPRHRLYRMFGLDLSSQSLVNIFMMGAMQRFSEQESETKVKDEALQNILDGIPFYFANLTMIESVDDQLKANQAIIDFFSKVTTYTTPRE